MHSLEKAFWPRCIRRNVAGEDLRGCTKASGLRKKPRLSVSRTCGTDEERYAKFARLPFESLDRYRSIADGVTQGLEDIGICALYYRICGWSSSDQQPFLDASRQERTVQCNQVRWPLFHTPLVDQPRHASQGIGNDVLLPCT